MLPGLSNPPPPPICRRIFAAHEVAALCDPSMATKMTVQWNLFAGTVLKLGTERHHGDFLRQIDRWVIRLMQVGCGGFLRQVDRWGPGANVHRLLGRHPKFSANGLRGHEGFLQRWSLVQTSIQRQGRWGGMVQLGCDGMGPKPHGPARVREITFACCVSGQPVAYKAPHNGILGRGDWAGRRTLLLPGCHFGP